MGYGKRRRRNRLRIFMVIVLFFLGVISAVVVYNRISGEQVRGSSGKVGKSDGRKENGRTVGEEGAAGIFRYPDEEGKTESYWYLNEEGETEDGRKPTGGEEDTDGGDDDNWKLTLVNKWNPISKDYRIKLIPLGGGHAIDERCYDDLQEMMDDCRRAGLSPLICSSYRTWEKQESLYNNKVHELMGQGYSREAAMWQASFSNAIPGTSEHQLGLAVDIVDSNYQLLDEGQEQTAVQKWLMENSYRYGFILRYPDGKTELTGIIYEPWHYRYVGREAAEEIYRQGICLEEYLAKFVNERKAGSN